MDSSENPDLYRRAKDICLSLVGLPAASRLTELRNLCNDDEELRMECESMLASFDTETQDFLVGLQVETTPGHSVDASSQLFSKVGQALAASIGDSTTTSQPFIAGELFADRYLLQTRLGSGGMGEVWSAFDQMLEETVALKRIHRRALRSHGSEGMRRLLAEASLARKVLHPGVCRIHDAGRAGDDLFLSMEYIAGGDLGHRLRITGTMTGESLKTLATDLASALTAIHASGLLHRDLKPANVLFGLDERARISDFGLAVEDAELEAADFRSGTGCYMAPEVLAGETPSQKSDLFAFGLVLYEACTGRRAFRTAEEVRTKALDQESPLAPSLYDPNIDPVIERIILRCISFDPDERPNSAETVVQVLQQSDPIDAVFLLGENPSAKVIVTADARGLLSKKRAWCTFAVICALLLASYFVSHRSHGRANASSLNYQASLNRAQSLIQTLAGETLDSPNQYSGFADLEGGFMMSGMTPADSQEAAGGIPFWYRESKDKLYPQYWPSTLAGRGRVTYSDPAPEHEGTTSVLLGRSGELLAYFQAGVCAPR